MAALHFAAKVVDPLLQRLHIFRGLGRVGFKGAHGDVQNFVHRRRDHRKVVRRLTGKVKALFKKLFCALRKIHCVVGDPFQVGQRAKIFCHCRVLPLCQLHARQLHQIAAELVLIDVRSLFHGRNSRKALFRIVCQKPDRFADRHARDLCHFADRHTHLLHGKSGMAQKPRFQPQLGTGGLRLRLFLYKTVDDRFQHTIERHQKRRHGNAQHAVDRCNGKRGNCHA